ncbi:MAG TPA: DUF748 domain-containing protein [Noviherbaspirillum sp.]
MKDNRLKHTLLVAGIVLAILGGAAAVGLHFAAGILKTQVEQALGTNSEVREITLGWSSVQIHGIRIRAPKGWPTADTLRAERIVIRPDLLGLFTARVHVPRITVEQAYVSAVRTREGKVRLLPSLLEAPGKRKGASPGAMPEIRIGTIELRDGVLEFFDATVRQPAHKTRLEQLQAKVDDLQLPALASRTHLQLDGTVKGVQRDGKLSIDGWAELGAKNSDIATRLQGVDLLAFQPYLIKASEAGVKRGTLDLKLKSSVRKNRLHAPGSITLSGLELVAGGGAFGTFMGMPRQAVIAGMKDRNDRITIDFTLDGDLNDPKFSLNDSFALQVGVALAKSLGISLEGLAKGLGSGVEGLGGAVKKLFGQ